MGQRSLEKMGYHVLPAGLPGEAIRIAEAYPGDIHLLMTDVVMPEMNGRELAEHLSKSRPKMRVLFVSGYSAEAIAVQGILDEGIHFIQKPYTLQALAEKLRTVMEEVPL